MEKSVPNITGLTVRQAEAELAKVGLKLGKRSEAPSELEEGRIIEQYPTPGTPISSGVATVNFTVSNGDYEAGPSVDFVEIDGWRVPNVVGMTVKKARTLLSEHELSLGDATVVSSSESAGIILAISIGYNIDGEPVVNYEVSAGLN